MRQNNRHRTATAAAVAAAGGGGGGAGRAASPDIVPLFMQLTRSLGLRAHAIKSEEEEEKHRFSSPQKVFFRGVTGGRGRGRGRAGGEKKAERGVYLRS